MINKIITLFKIARKLAQSNAIKIIAKFHEPPKIIKIFSYLLSFSFSSSNKLVDKNLNEEQKVKIDKLIDLIDEDDDVQNVYTDLE